MTTWMLRMVNAGWLASACVPRRLCAPVPVALSATDRREDGLRRSIIAPAYLAFPLLEAPADAA